MGIVECCRIGKYGSTTDDHPLAFSGVLCRVAWGCGCTVSHYEDYRRFAVWWSVYRLSSRADRNITWDVESRARRDLAWEDALCLAQKLYGAHHQHQKSDFGPSRRRA